MKKIFIVSSVLLVVVLVFLGIYNFAFNKKSPLVEDSSPVDEIDDKGGLFGFGKIKKKEKLYALTDEAVISPALSEDGKYIDYYLEVSGNVQRVYLEDLKKEIISPDTLIGLKDVRWSPNRKKVISKFSRDGGVDFYFYDHENKSGTKLRNGIDNIAWTNLGDKIIYKYFDAQAKKRSLNIADPNGSNWEKIADISYRNASIAQIPQTSMISFWNEPNAFEETSFQTVSLAGGEIKKVFWEKFGADYLWSPDGKKVLASFLDAKGGSKLTLGVLNSNGGEYLNLNIPTLISKSIWSKNNKTIYYALPGSISETAVMPNDYYEGKLTTQDTFWKINIESGKQERVIELAELEKVGTNFDATNLFLSKNEDTLFFTDKTSGKLYGISL